MTKKNSLITILILLIFGLLIFGYFKRQSFDKNGHNTLKPSEQHEEASYILDDYPLDVVPIHSVEKISSMKFFVNDDQSSEYLYGGPVNYYNVVFYPMTNRDTLFDSYQKLMNSINEDESSDSKLSGFIGDYRVDVSQYSQDADAAYLQVILPFDEFQKTNPYFADYPNLVDIDLAWVEKESSYGLLHQSGGEIEYTQYFIVDESVLDDEAKEKPFKYFFDTYKQKYQDKTGFTADEEKLTLTWVDGEYELTMVFSDEHMRVYFMIRRPIS
jgi:hypothetical protein